MLTHAGGAAFARPEINIAHDTPQALRRLVNDALSNDNADTFLASRGASGQLEALAQRCCDMAFAESDLAARRTVHRVLHDLYGLHLSRPHPGLTDNQYSIELLRARRAIEASWMEWELGQGGWSGN